MSLLTLEIPDEALVALRGSEEAVASRLLLAAAMKLFEMGEISSGAAASLAGVPREAGRVRNRYLQTHRNRTHPPSPPCPNSSAMPRRSNIFTRSGGATSSHPVHRHARYFARCQESGDGHVDHSDAGSSGLAEVPAFHRKARRCPSPRG